MIDQLLNIVAREAKLFETFLQLLREQQATLVANDVTGLAEITARQQACLNESLRLNREREALIARIAEANAIEGDVTVSRLLEVADADQAARLYQLRELVFTLHEQIEKTRNSNALLINQSRQVIADTMNMLSRMHLPEGAYTQAGTARDNRSTLVMDRRA